MNGYDGFKKWTEIEKQEISVWLQQSNKRMPSEIHRSIRGLQYVKNWKAVEFRTLLLYTGMVFLKDFLPLKNYEHFLNLCLAVTICSCNAYKKYIPIAKECFKDYLEKQIEYYGENTIGSNFHNIIHIVEDVIKFGNLNSISTYDFENCLRHLKLSLQQCNRPLEQIVRRLAEQSCDKSNQWRDKNNIEWCVKYSYKISDNHSTVFYKQIRFGNDLIFSSKTQKDKFFLTHQNEIVEMVHAMKINNQFHIYGYSIKNKCSFFKKPFSSDRLSIFLSNCEKNAGEYYPVSTIKCKMVSLYNNSDCVFIPLIHSIDLLNDYHAI